MKIRQKISSRYNGFKIHPVTKNHPYKALLRYLFFNIKCRIKAELTYLWLHNLKFYARKGDAGIVGNIYYGLSEFYESMFVLHYLKKDDVFVDVGANIGHYSLLASGIKDAYSIAIEPVPSSFEQLKRQVGLNNLENKIKIINLGVSDKKGTLNFSTDKNTMNRVVKNDYKNSIEVQVDKLDSILKEINPNVLKIDVEGFEKFALLGAKGILSNALLKAIVIEINFSNAFYGVENIEILDILSSYGFNPYSYNPETRLLSALNSYNQNQFNTIFIRDIEKVNQRISKSKQIKILNKQF